MDVVIDYWHQTEEMKCWQQWLDSDYMKSYSDSTSQLTIRNSYEQTENWYGLYWIHEGPDNYTITSQIQTSQKKHTGRAKEKRERGTGDETSSLELSLFHDMYPFCHEPLLLVYMW
jgi:hypothetical protein